MEKIVEHLLKARFAIRGFGGNTVVRAACCEGLTVTSADDAARQCREILAGREGWRKNAEVATSYLKGIEEAAGEVRIDLACDGGSEEQGDGELDGLAVGS